MNFFFKQFYLEINEILKSTKNLIIILLIAKQLKIKLFSLLFIFKIFLLFNLFIFDQNEKL